MRHALFKPVLKKIKRIVEETPDTRSFYFDKDGWAGHTPGQFAELWVPGVGEIPISIASPSKSDELVFTVKKVGTVSSALFEKKVSDTIGLRGPFGHGFPLQEFAEKNLILIGGGIGLPPLMSVILEALGKNKIRLFYGARTPADIVYKPLLNELKDKIDIYLTVDVGDESWDGEVGVVTNLLKPELVHPYNSVAFVCGPGIMMYYTVKRLLELGFREENIYLSLEHHMKCAVGKCGHCRIGPYYVCVDGPVFPYSKLREVEEKFAGTVF